MGPYGGSDDTLHGVHVGGMARSCKHRQVYIVSLARPAPAVGDRTCFERIVALLMQRDRQHIVPVIVDGLGAIAVMYIPIQHHNPLAKPPGLGGLDGNGDIQYET